MVVEARGGGYGARIGPLGVVPLEAYGANMGKGLEEPCSPYREAYFFGAEPGAVDASGWNCFPEVVDATRLFDLSRITPAHEVAVVILYASNLPAGRSYDVHFKLYRDRDGKLLWDLSYTIPDPGNYGRDYWSWYYVYCVFGYFPGEFWENGDYHVALVVTGRSSQTLNLTITGIAPAEPIVSQFEIVDYIKV